MKPVIVIGHKNPDSDSICSAICYANLKRKLTGRDYIACRAGDINNETKYILDKESAPIFPCAEHGNTCGTTTSRPSLW